MDILEMKNGCKLMGKHVPQETKIRTVKSREKRKEIVI